MLSITILAVGRLGRGPEHDLTQQYLSLLTGSSRWKVNTIEIDDRKAPQGAGRKAWDKDRLLAKTPKGASLTSLDERGKTLSSMAFADHLKTLEERAQPVCFAIGGPDGLDEGVRTRSDLLLSFGKMTWPHRLVRAMLAEQLYRAGAILSGHPYHREG